MLQGLRNVILAILLVGSSGFALLYSWQAHVKIESQAKTALGLSALEHSLLRSLAGSKSAEGPFEISGSVTGLKYKFNLKPEEIRTLGKAFEPCESYPSEGCGYKVRLSFDPKRTAYSYEVTSAYAEAPFSLHAEGRLAVLKPSASLPNEAEVVCDPRKSIAAIGYSTSSGLSCLAKPENTCAPGTLPKGLTVTGVVPHLEFICGEPSKTARCPAGYSLQSLDTRTLDANGKVKATCVRSTQTVLTSDLMTPAKRLSGRACPFGYKSDSSCSFVNVVAKPARCGGKGSLVQPVAGKLAFVQNVNAGFVDCGMKVGTQSCGATWSADVQLKIKCVLDQPEYANVQ